MNLHESWFQSLQLALEWSWYLFHQALLSALERSQELMWRVGTLALLSWTSQQASRDVHDIADGFESEQISRKQIKKK